jgi:predicted transposase YdaD
MIYKELMADPLFREMLVDEREEGRQEGALQTAQQIAIRLVAKRFPELEKFAKIVIAAVSDVERLQMLIIELSIASSQDQARELLFSPASDS